MRPEVGWIKEKFDGASKDNSWPSRIGCIVKDYEGRIICQKLKGLGICSNNEAEF